MEIVDRIAANHYPKEGKTIVHLEMRDAISNASEGAEQIEVDCIAHIEGTVAVYFERNGYAELAAIFADEETYIATLPALEKLAEKRGFDKVTESIQ